MTNDEILVEIKRLEKCKCVRRLPMRRISELNKRIDTLKKTFVEQINFYDENEEVQDLLIFLRNFDIFIALYNEYQSWEHDLAGYEIEELAFKDLVKKWRE